ncbi:tetratricopeptide repeat protein [Singulisphaera acidiphila]|uniref:Tetratricopeptide repeat protein n=1 Tax=Singulisphaera acidiphila (strain ATCC BAA-1392 / DSM 18658 / VKM B-2454 / MOB10) TaxID=886293 RepID=L0DK72_SINAD|nr:hypothetical protein [Singulisphaera acidiphila]AGA29233.1 hypothetical protein Sinac_5081 [Singulisphaera acidiphila DSM 18658]
MIRRMVLLTAVLGLPLLPTFARAAATSVDPSELTKRPDLIGREVSVDDRVALFLFHQGRDFDEITLKRTPVLFRLPPRLRYRQSPGVPAVRLTGILKREGEQWVCDVTTIELFPKDLVRLNRGVSILPAGEFEKRTAWAAWADRRAKEFQDEELLKRAREIEGDAIRFEAESRSTDPAKLWLKLAHRARAHGLQEPEPSALAHRSFRARLETAKEPEALSSLLTDLNAFLADSTTPVAVDAADLATWEGPYATKPAETYRAAPVPVRKTFDHRLWADVTQRLLERTAELEPHEALNLAERARRQLPDRPKVAERLYEQALKAKTVALATLRLSEVKSLAKIYSEQLHQPERARDLIRSWLDEQRSHQMSPTDAEGRLGLATLYESLIEDKETAIELLQSAWKIDPQSKEVADAFRRRGFRKVDDEWVESTRSKPNSEGSVTAELETTPPPAPQNRKLTNLTTTQVRALLGGKPNRVIFSGTQGQLVEQWIYFGTKQDQYINFLRTPGSDAPRVIAYYSLPRSAHSPRP